MTQDLGLRIILMVLTLVCRMNTDLVIKYLAKKPQVYANYFTLVDYKSQAKYRYTTNMQQNKIRNWKQNRVKLNKWDYVCKTKSKHIIFFNLVFLGLWRNDMKEHLQYSSWKGPTLKHKQMRKTNLSYVLILFIFSKRK